VPPKCGYVLGVDLNRSESACRRSLQRLSPIPLGSGTPQQGERVYIQHCASCHGFKGAGKPNDQLVGGQGSLAGAQTPVKTVGSYWPYATTIFDTCADRCP
jgi:mono/diheme cytochrome c family protein